jgi:hypothetical protein
MKTPREILLARHSQIEPKLDAIRQQALAALPRVKEVEETQVSRSEGFSSGSVLRKVWLELIWPSRRAWAGMATLWVAVLAVNLAMKANSPAGTVVRSAPAREVVRAFAEQQRLLTELLPPTEPAPLQPPQRSERPRSERPTTFKMA